MKLYEAGVPNESLLRLLDENVRNGEQVLGDLHSFVAANALGAERLLSFMADYGMHDLARARRRGAGPLARRRCATPSRALPDGVYDSEIWNNPLGTPLRYPREAHGRRATAIEVDFDGAPPQLPQRRAELHAELHGGARDLPAEMHADARACAAMPAATGRSR